MVFLTLLALAVGGVALLTAGFIGLLEAPWQLLLALLVAALVGLQWLTLRSQAALPSAESSAFAPDSPSTADQRPGTPLARLLSRLAPATTPIEASAPPTTDRDQLIYRGIPYQPRSSANNASPTPTQDPASPTLEGVYRGSPWQKSVAATGTEAQDGLIYRGRPVRKPHS